MQKLTKKNRVVAIAAAAVATLGLGIGGAALAHAEDTETPDTAATAPATTGENGSSSRGRSRTPIDVSAASVTPAQAAQTAISEVGGGQVTSITLRNNSEGVLVYHVKVTNGEQHVSVTINAANREVLNTRERAAGHGRRGNKSSRRSNGNGSGSSSTETNNV